MKNFMFITALAGSLLSCSLDRAIDLENFEKQSDTQTQLYPQKWELVKMSGSIANVPPTTGTDMPYQEYYVLHGDSTFVKVRERDATVAEASGTFALITHSDRTILELSYASANDLIGNCGTEAKEFHAFESENLLVGTWWACDGPGLFYERVH